MPINKKAHTRYLTYDRCLSNRGRRYSWTELQDEVNNALAEEGYEGIGKTQFYEDIKFMERSEWQAPIERYKDGRTVYYRYSDKNYSIINMPLNETELKQIKSAVEVMSRIKGLPQFEWINEIIPAMESKFGLIQTDK